MKCTRCNADVEWPDSIAICERIKILRLAHQSRAQAQLHLVTGLGFSMLKAKEIVVHLARENNGCCRPRCSGKVEGVLAPCPKCGAVNLGFPGRYQEGD